MEICRLEAPTDEDWDAICNPLSAFNREKVGRVGSHDKVVFALRAPENRAVVGGLWAEMYWNWLSVQLLIVPAEARGHGIGSELLRRAEKVARDNGCVGAWLDTFSAQAPVFYRNRGYEVFGELENYPNGESRVFLRKHLAR